jgi:hypothetical protein
VRRSQKQCLKCGKKFAPTSSIGTLSCPHCGAEIKSHFTYDAPQKDYSPYPNRTPLRVGMKAMFGGKEYVLLGRSVLSMKEEGVTYYWDEFQLVADDGTILYLDYDEGKFTLMEPFEPAEPLSPQQANRLQVGSSVDLDGTRGRITEKARATIQYVQGSLTYDAQVGETYWYANAQHVNKPFCIEWDQESVQYYRGKHLAKRDVYTYFGLKDALTAMNTLDNAERAKRNFAGCCLLLSLIAFVLWAFFLSSGKVLVSETVTAPAVGRTEQKFGPYHFNLAERGHRIVLHGSVTRGEAWAAAVVETPEGRELFGTQGDFWNLDGTDADGYWSENVTQDSHMNFRVTRPGPFYVHLYAEGPAVPAPTTSSATGIPAVAPTNDIISVRFELQSEIIHPGPMLFYGVTLLLISLLYFCLGSSSAISEAASRAASSS